MQNISGVYFTGGFCTVAWVNNVNEYEALQPDKIVVMEVSKIKRNYMASSHSHLESYCLLNSTEKGIERAQFNIQRLRFKETHSVATLVEEAKSARWKVIAKGNLHNLQKWPQV